MTENQRIWEHVVYQHSAFAYFNQDPSPEDTKRSRKLYGHECYFFLRKKKNNKACCNFPAEETFEKTEFDQTRVLKLLSNLIAALLVYPCQVT